MKVIKWIYPDIKHNGYFNYNYINEYHEAHYDENYEDAIIKELVDNLYTICGDTHQYRYIPVFDDNTYVLLSMRKWGEIMAKARNLIEGRDKYDYRDFYLVSLCKQQENLPKR